MDLRYPIGHFYMEKIVDNETIKSWIREIEDAPNQLHDAVSGLTEAQLDTPYRPNGWTVRQVVHHLADAHINGFIRIKLGLTADRPTITPYNEMAWANLADSALPIEPSLHLFTSVHTRMVTVLKSLNREQVKRIIIHPENSEMSIEKLIGVYAWHAKHHIAHIISLRERMGW